MNIDIIIKELDKLLDKAIAENEVPIAALIVKDNKIISKAYNKVEKNNSVLNHAEILAIKKANKTLNNWRLDSCTMYVTLEPCEMCKSIIKKSRINNIYYFIKQNDNKTEKDPIYNYIENKLFNNKICNFFKKRR